jgi:phage-related protein
MPRTRMMFYRDEAGKVPVVEWLEALRRTDRKAYAKCVVRIRRLAEMGHELRRPEADFLREGIYELRAKKGRVNYRILYFFHGSQVAILGHALSKEGAIPDAEIERAIKRKEAFVRNPTRHSYQEEGADGED